VFYYCIAFFFHSLSHIVTSHRWLALKIMVSLGKRAYYFMQHSNASCYDYGLFNVDYNYIYNI
jgi:hypothetical protein